MLVLALGVGPGDPLGARAAVHDAGVAACSYCHIMHESEDGEYLPAGEGLLRGASASDVCLSCHATANGAVFGFDPLNPTQNHGAGNFIFLLEDDLNDRPDGFLLPIPGEAAGHSVVAPAEGLTSDSRWSVAPGGTFPSGMLGCTSCHDPHGNSNYRMLYGIGDVQGGQYWFGAPAPQAEGVDLDGPAESRTNHTYYRSGWEQWCGNCHAANYHDMGGTGFDHPSDQYLDTGFIQKYNMYTGDGSTSRGIAATAYLPEVPFEDVSGGVSSTQGASPFSRLTCVTCHRAHASSAPAALRWDGRAPTLGQDGVVSGSYPIPNPFPNADQRALCVKCHRQNHGGGVGCLTCHVSLTGD